jgi:hypothetical protein
MNFNKNYNIIGRFREKSKEPKNLEPVFEDLQIDGFAKLHEHRIGRHDRHQKGIKFGIWVFELQGLGDTWDPWNSHGNEGDTGRHDCKVRGSP